MNFQVYDGKGFLIQKNVVSGEIDQMFKCSMRLKGKTLLVKKQSEHTQTYKLTPFTCTYLLPSFNSSSSTNNNNNRYIITITELLWVVSLGNTQSPTHKQTTKYNFISEINFIMKSMEEAQDFSIKIQNNIFNYCKKLIIPQEMNGREMKTQSPPPQPLTITTNNSQLSINKTIMEGFLIRKNQKLNVKTYEKPSIIYAEFQSNNLIFYSTQKKNRVADVLSCRIDFSKDKLLVEYKKEEHPYCFYLQVLDPISLKPTDVNEVFVCPFEEELNRWLSCFKAFESSNKTMNHLEEEPFNNEEQNNEEEEMDPEIAALLGLSGENTMVVHDSVKASDETEPDIFGKRKRNVFGGTFWRAPSIKEKEEKKGSATTPTSNAPITPTSIFQIQTNEELRGRVCELERQLEEKTKECDSLKEELRKARELIEQLQIKN
ncbi:hypothetical protein ABK040_014340 [Willaertia magna]